MKKFNLNNQYYADPLDLFTEWFEEAKQKEINDPNAMNLATISKHNIPSSRIVLLKSFDKNGFIFYSNKSSKKGKSILNNPNVALNFYWKSIRKQIRIEGIISEISKKESEEYFQSRNYKSKIGAWASKQSRTLNNRQELEDRFSKYSMIYNKSVPRPSYWIGFRIVPNLFEFWKEKKYRMHDRIEYKKKIKEWSVKRLYP